MSYALIRQARPVVAAAAVLALGLFASGCGQRTAVRENTGPARQNGEILFSKNYRLYLMRPDGTHQRPIPGSPRDVTDASWSPDGTRIAFSSYRDEDPDIYTMRASDGGDVTKLTFNNSVDVSPAYSPDGTKICFVESGSSMVPELEARVAASWRTWPWVSRTKRVDSPRPRAA